VGRVSPENHTPNRFDPPESLHKIDCVEKISVEFGLKPSPHHKPSKRKAIAAKRTAQEKNLIRIRNLSV
jgi:hypothetical protein